MSSVKQLEKLAWEIFKKKGREKYYPINKVYSWFPWITGCPEIQAEKVRPFIGRSLFSRKPMVKAKIAPKYCHLRKIINFPFRKWGAPHVSIVGNYGTGKSILMNLIIAFFLARGIRIMQFNDRRLECRHLAAHGWYDKDHKFHPFEIEIFIPKGYQFRKENPPWKYYPNIKPKYWTHFDEIIESMNSYKMTVVYEECFTEEGKLQLWIDLMDALAENINPNIVHMFTHHELSSLIPETPTKEIYKLVRRASNVAMNLRKDRIGLLTTFHMPSEVFYRVSHKFGFVIFKRPVNRRDMYEVEKDARSFGVKKCNISRGGYWMTHTIGYYPELPDIFKLIPQREKLTYPELEFEKNGKDKSNVKYSLGDKSKALSYKLAGLTYEEIEELMGIPTGTQKSWVHQAKKEIFSI